MYNAKQALTDTNLILSERQEKYWKEGKIKTYGIENLIRGAVKEGKRSITLKLLVKMLGDGVFYLDSAGTYKFDDLLNCLNYYGYNVSQVGRNEFDIGETKYIDFKISW